MNELQVRSLAEIYRAENYRAWPIGQKLLYDEVPRLARLGVKSAFLPHCGAGQALVQLRFLGLDVDGGEVDSECLRHAAEGGVAVHVLAHDELREIPDASRDAVILLGTLDLLERSCGADPEREARLIREAARIARRVVVLIERRRGAWAEPRFWTGLGGPWDVDVRTHASGGGEALILVAAREGTWASRPELAEADPHLAEADPPSPPEPIPQQEPQNRPESDSESSEAPSPAVELPEAVRAKIGALVALLGSGDQEAGRWLAEAQREISCFPTDPLRLLRAVHARLGCLIEDLEMDQAERASRLARERFAVGRKNASD